MVPIMPNDPEAGTLVLIQANLVRPDAYLPFSAALAPEIGYGRVTFPFGAIFSPVALAPRPKKGSEVLESNVGDSQGAQARDECRRRRKRVPVWRAKGSQLVGYALAVLTVPVAPFSVASWEPVPLRRTPVSRGDPPTFDLADRSETTKLTGSDCQRPRATQSDFT